MGLEQELQKRASPVDTFLAVGVFDGVHLGHQHLLRRLQERAEERKALPGVLTFSRHPVQVLSPETPVFYLAPLKVRTKLLRALGIPIVITIPFTREVAGIPARHFLELLIRYLRMKGLVVGPDFALGRGREGDVKALRALAAELGFELEVAHPFVLDGQVVSSTAIRQALEAGDMKKVRQLLGRPYAISGAVVAGRGLGQGLGFPTANLRIPPEQALPADGVYAGLAYLGGKARPSLTNIGVRPTFGAGERLVEVHILDFQREIYGKELPVELLERLRDEKAFRDRQELQAQIARDVRLARELLKA
jgi:riboflavin kinase/FMN adenylyltransferase